jgi:hypothetical protein
MFCVVCLENFAPSETELMLRQGMHKVIAWIFAKRDFQGARNFLSRLLLPLWPTYEFADLTNAGAVTGAIPSPACQRTGDAARRQLHKVNAAVDINPGSGEAFFRGRRPSDGASVRRSLGPIDLLCHIFPIRLERERALVLYSGSSTDIASFVGSLLPRFFALDEVGAPADMSLLVNLRMAKQRYFQDALIDQVFRPRPLEILRQFHLVSPKTLYVLPDCSWDRRLLDRAAAKCAEVYGPYPMQDRTVFLCAGGQARASKLAAKFLHLSPDFFERKYIVIDPNQTPLRDSLHAVAGASLVVAPNTGEAAILALAPSKKRVLYELQQSKSPGAIPPAAMEDSNAKIRIIRIP